MNNTFNIKRFGQLLKKALLEKPVQTFGFTVLLLGLTLILYAVTKSLSGFAAAQNLAFIWGLAGGGFFLASFVFGYFNSNASGSSYLTLPASLFEKWFCGIVIAGILYPLIFLLFFRVIDSSFVAVYHHSLDPSSPFYKQQYESVFIFDFNGIVAWKVYSMFFFLTGSMLTGSLYFNKVAFIKTAIVLCLLFFGVFGLNALIAKMFFGNINDSSPFSGVVIPLGREEGRIELPSGIVNIFNYSMWYVVPAILWLLSFTRLREKEF